MYLYMICGNIKIKIWAILYIRKMGVVTKISIRCKALDANPMAHVQPYSAIQYLTFQANLSRNLMEFLEWRF